MSKIYFSRSMTRTMSADHPVGDPTGGAAYGEKNDPISAAISLATMYGTASAGFAAMTVMQGITFAGAAMSLVGNVTGNKTLSKIGMITGIAGGIGTFAESKGLFSSGNLKESLGMGTPAASNTSTAAGAMQSQSGSLSQTPSTDVADEMAAARQSAAVEKARIAGPDGTVKNTAAQPGAAYQTTAPPSSSAEYLKDFKPADYSAGSITTGKTVGLTTNPPPAGTPQLNVPNEPGVFDNLKKGNYWEATKQAGSAINPITNPYGAMAAGSIAQPISDYLSGKTDAEIDALEAQTGYADARAMQMQEEIATEKRRRANLNAGYGQVNTGINVNPAAMAQAQAGGLISGAMQPA